MTATHVTADAGVFVRNMGALWRNDARLAMAVDAVHPENVPEVERTKDGNWTVRVGGMYLHSKYKPEQEARGWAEGQVCGDRYVVVASGFGLGYHIKTLFERMPEDALLVIAEPNVGVLKAAIQVVDLVEVLGSNRVMIFTSLDRGALVERLEPRSVLFTSGAGTLLVTHPASAQVVPAFHSAFQNLITEFIAFTRTGFLTLMLNNVTTCRNIANNLGRYATTPPIDGMYNAFAGKPAVLVAAGPSLAKNMHLLPEMATHALLISVQTMLKPLLAAGIRPDFVTSLDYNTVSTRFFENLEENAKDVHLVAETKANWNVLDMFQGTMSLAQNDFADKLLRDTFPKRMGLKAGATVAHLSFYLAEFLGCDPIILVGQDLGFVDGLYYKPGTAIHETWGVELGRFNTLETKEWERIVRSRAILRKIPDIHGHPMYTEEQFFVYLQQFERDFAASRCRVIDATEGGAKKQGVEVMTLRAALAEIETAKRRSGEAAMESAPVRPDAWKYWTCDVVDNLERLKETLIQRRVSAVGMKETCEKTIPLLKEMVEYQADAARMSRLFVEVDRQRSRVGEDPGTFEMVCHLNTIGELRRFQADLLVKSANKKSGAAGGGLEHQKRQLQRDIEYVGDLLVGCERLLAIIDEAMVRAEKQIAAAREGLAWPREVAGS